MVCSLLRRGELRETHGILPWGSNYTFLMSVCADDAESLAIYKPRRGERPLWDFPDGTLCLREVAAFQVSEVLKWHIVPPTILREGPQGVGMMQQFIEHDPDRHYFTFGAQHRAQLQMIALFDLLINNADRKGGHCLLDSSGNIWAIDHGICFHTQPKLRTVIWDFAEESIPEALLNDLVGLLDKSGREAMSEALHNFVSQIELQALFKRGEGLLRTKKYPEPGPGRQYPWPPI
jgi:uncharacterized repeat protein (TIGR03843 family)